MKKFLNIVYLSLIVSAITILAKLYFLDSLFYAYDSGVFDYYVSSNRAKIGESEQSYYNDKVEEIVVVDIDELSLRKENLGKFYNWSHVESYAKVVKNMSRDTPRVISFDIIVDEEADKEKEEYFLNAIKSSGKVISALYFDDADEDEFTEPDTKAPYNYEKDSYIIPNSEIISKEYDHMGTPYVKLYESSKANGMVLFKPDADGVIRRLKPFITYLDRQIPFLGLQMFIQANDVKDFKLNNNQDSLKLINSQQQVVRSIPLEDGHINISYIGLIQKFRTIPFFWVYDNDEYKWLEPGFFKDKYVIIGSSAAGLFDLRVTPVFETLPGVGIHANLLHTILKEDYVKKLGMLEIAIFTFLLVLITALVVAYKRAIFISLFLLLIILFVFMLGLILHDEYNLFIESFTLIVSIILSLIVTYAYKYTTEEKDKQMIKSAFSQFVNKKVVDDLLADPSKLRLGGEKKNCSVFFSDIAGFTTISEQLDPESLVKLLNKYLTDMTNIIFDNDGMIDKYIGDAIMAIYGAPVATGNHAYQACKSAIDQQRRLSELREELIKEGYPSLLARMGINSGEMVVGNMGSQDYFNYTVMGDAVNLAARLEPANKDYDTLIMIGQNTYEMAKDFIFARQLDLMVVKGKTEPVAVFELYGVKDYQISLKEEDLLESYVKGYQLYLKREWDSAIDKFQYCLNLFPEDGPSKVFIDRCKYYKENEPEASWSGVYIRKTK
jgi:adenylate cyclase